MIGLLYLAVSRMLHFIWSFIQDLPVLYAGIEGDVQSSLGRLEGIFDFMPETMRDAWMTLGDNLGAYIGKLAESIASPTMEAAGMDRPVFQSSEKRVQTADRWVFYGAV